MFRFEALIIILVVIFTGIYVIREVRFESYKTCQAVRFMMEGVDIKEQYKDYIAVKLCNADHRNYKKFDRRINPEDWK
jgi:hypothetical protein